MNDNEKYLKEFLDATKGYFKACMFSDMLILTDNSALNLTAYFNSANIYNTELVYMDINQEIAKQIDLSVASKSKYGLFIRDKASSDPLHTPYNACVLGNSYKPFSASTQVVNHHHLMQYQYNRFDQTPDLPLPEWSAFNVRAVTLNGNTIMENETFRTLNTHLQALDTIMDTVTNELTEHNLEP